MPATIKTGSTGADVASWQALLTSAGYSTPATGTFDDTTKAQTIAWQKANGLTADGIAGPQSWAKMTGKPVEYTASADAHAQFGRDAILAAWPEVTGEQPNLAELQIAGAQAHLESNYGLAQYVNKTIPEGQPGHSSGVINNWGAVQGQPGFLASDTHADGSAYTAHYKIYPTPAAGAADMIRHMTVKRPTSWAHMKAGDIDAWAHAMRTTDPITHQGLYFEQDPDHRAKGIAQRVANIAYTLHEPIAAKRGGPVTPAEAAPADDGSGGALAPVTQKSIAAAALAAIVAALAWWWWK